MAHYGGRVEPVIADDVVVGDRLVDDRPERGYLTVTDLRVDGGVTLWFDSGEHTTHPSGTELWRVAR